jgi:hypothetical protein
MGGHATHDDHANHTDPFDQLIVTSWSSASPKGCLAEPEKEEAKPLPSSPQPSAQALGTNSEFTFVRR